MGKVMVMVMGKVMVMVMDKVILVGGAGCSHNRGRGHGSGGCSGHHNWILQDQFDTLILKATQISCAMPKSILPLPALLLPHLTHCLYPKTLPCPHQLMRKINHLIPILITQFLCHNYNLHQPTLSWGDMIYIKTQVFRLLRYDSPAPRNIARSDWVTQNITHNMTSSIVRANGLHSL